MKEENSRFCANTIGENNLDFKINDEIIAPVIYDGKRVNLKIFL